MNVEYKQIKVSDLTEFHIRDIRPAVVEDIKERIAKGYNPARPLTVVPDNDTLTVADGNHRLEALIALGIEDVPCVVHNGGDAYALAFAGNADEDSYSPMDVFDYIESIAKMRDSGLTQSSIGERIGWSRAAISQYIGLMESVATNVLAKCKEHQDGRVAKNATSVALYNFTEGWFRNSGLYKLAGRGVYDVGQDAEDKSLIMEDEDGNKLDTGARYQLQMIEAFIGERMARDYLKRVVHPHGVLLQADWIFRRRENDVFNYYLVEVKRQDIFLADDGVHEVMPFDGHGLPPRQVKARLTLY